MNPVVRLLLIAWAGCALASLLAFVFAVNSNASIERALEEKYAADITLEQHNRKRVLLVDGELRNCKVTGQMFSLDDVAIRCFVNDEPPSLR